MKKENSQSISEDEQTKKEKANLVKIVIIAAVNAFCIIAFFVCLLLSSSIREPLRSQQAATTWAGQSGERFAQLSAFFPDSFGFSEDKIFTVRRSLDQSLLTASLESMPGRILYTDAWSAETNVTIPTDRGSVEAKAIAVGGDFFLFHPLYLRDGNYLTPNDFMKDRIVIDEVLAWRLFGASRVAGFEVILNDRIFIVAGVISRENDFASSMANTDEFLLFMSFEALMAMKDDEAEITTYEIVMPDPISNFALNALADAISDESVLIVENSARFSLGNSFRHIGAFGRHSIRSGGAVLPYWENAARIVEDWLALLLVLSLVFIIFPIICAVIYTVKLIRFGLRRGKDAVKDIIDEKDQRKYEQYLLEHGDEPQIYDNDMANYDMYDDDHIINYDVYDVDDVIDYDIVDDSIDYDAINYDIVDSIKHDVGDMIDIDSGDSSDKDLYIDILYNTSSFDIPSYGIDDETNNEIIDSIKNDVNDIMNFGNNNIADKDNEEQS